ncbi:MAG: hypothetical protein Q8P24_19240 [Desulfobacterales bacterium]|nr:hypothetical protein [Desulfobacterales bacterium]
MSPINRVNKLWLLLPIMFWAVFGTSNGFAQLKIESVYPTLGVLGQDLAVTIQGEGFDGNTRISMGLDVGNKRAFIGSEDTQGEAYRVTVVGGTAYVADGVGGLQVIDVSNPASPQIIGSVDTPGDAISVTALPATKTLTKTTGPDIYEDDDTFQDAKVIVLNDQNPENTLDGYEKIQHHTIHDEGDEDWVMLYGLAGETYKISLDSPGVNLDAVIGIYESDGQTLAIPEEVDDTFSGEKEFVEWEASETGIYYVRVRNFKSAVYGAGTEYQLTLTQPYAAFSGFITGTVSPIVSGTLTTGYGAAIILPNGRYFMPHIAGTFTLTVTANEYNTYTAPVTVGELAVTTANVTLTPTTAPTTTTTSTTTTTVPTTTTTTVPQTTTTTTIPAITETLIDLSPGWNLISSPLEPENSQIHTVFFGIEDQIVSSWKWVENNWAVCLPGYDDDGAEYADQKGFSLLGELHAGEGFWVNASNSQYLAISGTQPSDSSISLSSGWNLVGLKSSSAKSVKDLISGNEAKIASIWKWENNTWAVYLPGEADGGADYAAGKGFGVLSNIEPGEGFWLNATQAVVLP